MNNHPLLQYISIASKQFLWEFGNSGTFGIPNALKNSANDVYMQSKLANEGLYYLQVKTFLETLELDNQAIEKFMAENPDHQRLGFEIFKILENTILEDQARMLAKSFKLFTQQQISKQNFDKYTYIITKLNNHLITLIKELYKASEDTKQSKFHFPSPNMDLISFEFLVEVENNHKFTTKSNYQRTEFFYDFYKNIFKD